MKRLHGHRVGPPPSFEKIEGSEFSIDCDLALLAMGFLHPQQEGLVEQLGVALDGRGKWMPRSRTTWAPCRACSRPVTRAAGSR